jgi:hypothetical protein
MNQLINQSILRVLAIMGISQAVKQLGQKPSTIYMAQAFGKSPASLTLGGFEAE